ncbi:hypothetical protein DL766_006674 [Monosporascus sp. MC13-8B]|uniref:Methyltransferase domain-containing protein n=1 Tax=Monosporascus cannonballus TaxID=155416 RepID=A0ABY0H0M9_9PEZI|nr:hypothetical protein DL763_010512 [Monosporascus cannonballus]RYO81497.1 hypothetical protein DL762_007074 [Monosporascus cannonballus]RYP26594.1 hypothetical protein DL766_006674 [Monosporascus sp. MC13-8B]
MADVTQAPEAQRQPASATTGEASASTKTWGAPAPVIVPSEPQESNEASNRDDDDADSSLGYDTASTTASLSSSIMDYRTIHGRTYHSEKHGTAYWGPNDERQNEALDISHHVLTLLLDGKLHGAPLNKNIQKVLDVGTGTGIWAVDFADEYPGAQVIGTDLSPIQPYWIPPNCKFEIDDAELPWTWPEGTFDYIHIRYLLGSISDWPQLFKQAFAALKPGGYVESFEPDASFESDDGSVTPDSPLTRWAQMNREGGKMSGKPFTIYSDNLQVQGMQEAGFTDITVKNFKIPVGPWPADPKLSEIGQYEQYAIEQDIEGTMMFMWDLVIQKPIEEMRLFAMSARKEMRKPTVHAYIPQRLVYARKPEA